MTQDDLLAQLGASEDNFVERKAQGVKPQDIRKALTAFANTLPEDRHGIIYIGIGDKGLINCRNGCGFSLA